MTLKRGTSFTGVAHQALLPQNPINQANLDTMADDQGYLFEKLHGKNADGGGGAAPTNTSHNHQEEGNRIFRVLFTQSFGLDNYGAELSDGTTDSNQIPFTLAPGGSTLSGDAMGIIAYVPPGFANYPILFMVDCIGSNPGLNAVVYESNLSTVVTRYGLDQMPHFQEDSNGIFSDQQIVGVDGLGPSTYGFSFRVSAAGVYIIILSGDVTTTDNRRQILSMHCVAEVIPSVRTFDPPVAQGTQVHGSALIQVGDADNSNAWHPVDSNLTGADSPLHSALTTILANNNAAIYEGATGNPVPGNPSINGNSVAHSHSGASYHGTEIDYVYWAKCFGGFLANGTSVYGNNSVAPHPPVADAAYVCHQDRILLPSGQNSAGGGSAGLRAYVLVYWDGNKTATSGDILLTINANTYTYRASGATTGYKLLTTTTGSATWLAYTANDFNTIGLEIKQNGGTNAERSISLVAVALVVKP